LVSPVFGISGERFDVVAGVVVYLFSGTPRAVALVIAKWVVVDREPMVRSAAASALASAVAIYAPSEKRDRGRMLAIAGSIRPRSRPQA
jgi:hypothetical protein